jgi:predicted phosphoadenosine phosphosulfate sulfurtransferase
VKAIIHKKHTVDRSCLELARERIAYLFEHFDHVVVAFSGGKDSTVCLNLALEQARALGRLPLDVYSFDEEAIPPETVDYMTRVAANPEIRFRWFCVPIEHRNACSTTSTYWYPWEPEARDRWVRELPPTAITDYPGFTRAGIREQMPAIFTAADGTLANIMGIRALESLSRYSAIAMKTGFLAFMSQAVLPYGKNAYPIYDWTLEDVWLAPLQQGWDYNRAYDVMEACGVARFDQRCAPPYGEQSIRRLFTYKLCWPHLWQKMVDRVPGAATGARYGRTDLYGVGIEKDDLPDGLTWREWTMETLRLLPPDNRREAAGAIKVGISIHRNRAGATTPIPDAVPHPVSGFCWKTLYLPAKVGGNKFGRISQKIANRAIKERRKHGH